MSDIKFNGEEDELLIELVAKNPPLFDPQVQLYKDVIIREDIWKDIAVKMNRNDVDCKRRWKYIRDSYNRFKRKRKMSTGSAAPSKNSKWELYKRLKFLEKISTEGASASNCLETVLLTTTNEEVEIPSGSEENPTTPTPTKTKDIQSSCKRRGMIENNFLNYLKKRDESRQVMMEELNVLKESDDEINSFGNHIKLVLRKLNPRLQIQAKSELFNILTKYEIIQTDMLSEMPPQMSEENYYLTSPVSPATSASTTST